MSRIKFQLTTAVWGARYVSEFLESTIPSMLAPGNLPALREVAGARYTIYTFKSEAKLLNDSPLIAKLRELMPVEFYFISEAIRRDNVHAAATRFWFHAAKTARAAGEVLFIGPSDVIWSNGSLRTIAQAFLNGYRSVWVPSFRATTEVLMPRLRADYRSPDGVLTIDSRSLVRLSLDCLSPLAIATIRENPYYSFWPEQAAYPVPGAGLVLASSVGHPWVFDPNFYEKSTTSLNDCWHSHYKIFDDSDEAMLISLSPLTQQMHWFFHRRRHDHINQGTMGLTLVKSAAYHRLFATVQKFRCAEEESAEWKHAVGRARIHALWALLHLKMVWAANTLAQSGCRLAAQLLAGALCVGRLHRHWRSRGPVSVLVPSDAALSDSFKALLDLPPAELSKWLLRLVIEGDCDVQSGAHALRNALGEEVRIEGTPTAIAVDGENPPMLRMFMVDQLPVFSKSPEEERCKGAVRGDSLTRCEV